MEGHRGPFWYYVVTIALGLTPWCIFLVATLRHTLNVAALPTQSTQPGRPGLGRAVSDFLGRRLSGLLQPRPDEITELRVSGLSAARDFDGSLLDLLASDKPLYRGGSCRVRWPGSLLLASPLPLCADRRRCAAAEPDAWPSDRRPGAVGIHRLGPDRRRHRRLARSAARATIRDDRRRLLLGDRPAGPHAIGPIHAVESQKATKALIDASGACRPAEEVRCASFCFFQPSLVFYCRREVPESATEQQALELLRPLAGLLDLSRRCGKRLGQPATRRRRPRPPPRFHQELGDRRAGKNLRPPDSRLRMASVSFPLGNQSLRHRRTLLILCVGCGAAVGQHPPE